MGVGRTGGAGALLGRKGDGGRPGGRGRRQTTALVRDGGHADRKTGEIIKTQLTKKERITYFSLVSILSLFFGYFLSLKGGNNPYIDSITTTFSIFAQILTVKRCMEQWYLWFFVNFLSLVMWIIAYLNGSNCLATIIMWGTYLFLSIYFLQQWKKELISNKDNNI